MAKLRQISIKFNYKQEAGKCDVCGNEDKAVVEVGNGTKNMSVCDSCADQLTNIHNNMKLMKTGG